MGPQPQYETYMYSCCLEPTQNFSVIKFRFFFAENNLCTQDNQIYDTKEIRFSGTTSKRQEISILAGNSPRGNLALITTTYKIASLRSFQEPTAQIEVDPVPIANPSFMFFRAWKLVLSRYSSHYHPVTG